MRKGERERGIKTTGQQALRVIENERQTERVRNGASERDSGGR